MHRYYDEINVYKVLFYHHNVYKVTESDFWQKLSILLSKDYDHS